MPSNTLSKWAGALFILGAILVNIPYTLLIVNFNYPDILRQPVGVILSAFSAGGAGLIWTWLGFAWAGAPLLAAILLLPRAFEHKHLALLPAATSLGVIGALVQLVGLLRWVFVVPGLAQVYGDPAASPAAKEAAGVAFQLIHQFGGVLLGEHLGQIFTIAWMGLSGTALGRARLIPAWMSWAGWLAGGVYLLAQSELFATVIPGLVVFDFAGLAGSLLWLAWMAGLGIFLLAGRPGEAV